MKVLCGVILIVIAFMSALLLKRESAVHNLKIDVHADGTIFITKNYDLLCTF